MNYSFTFVVPLFLVLGAFVLPVSVLEASEISERIHSHLKEAEAAGFSGAILLAEGENIVLDQGFGVANKSTGLKNSSDVIYDFGSLTKQFTATAILKLVEQRKLALEDKLSQFFEHVPNDKKNITVHHLLSHSSGIPSYTGHDFKAKSSTQLTSEIFSRPLDEEPGKQFIYSNYGYSLLGIIIEKVTGEEYEKHIKKALLDPAGLKQTGYTDFAWSQSNVAHGYKFSTGRDWGTSLRRYLENGVSWNLKANGGMLSTLKDLHKWRISVKQGNVISKASISMMHRPHTPINRNLSYGYGWRSLSTDNDSPIIFHGGSNSIFLAAIMDFQDDQQHMIFFVSNQQHGEVIKLIGELRKMIANPDYSPQTYRAPSFISRFKRLFF